MRNLSCIYRSVDVGAIAGSINTEAAGPNIKVPCIQYLRCSVAAALFERDGAAIGSKGPQESPGRQLTLISESDNPILQPNVSMVTS